MAGRVLRELPDREGYWLAGNQLALSAGRENLETEGFGDDKQVKQVVDTVGYTLAGTDNQEVADKDWREDKHLLESADTGYHASQAALASHIVVGGMGHQMVQLAGPGAFAHI